MPDSAPAHPARRIDVLVQTLLALTIGIVIGALGSQAMFAGRVATIETYQAAGQVSQLQRDDAQDRQLVKLQDISERQVQFTQQAALALTELVRELKTQRRP